MKLLTWRKFDALVYFLYHTYNRILACLIGTAYSQQTISFKMIFICMSIIYMTHSSRKVLNYLWDLFAKLNLLSWCYLCCVIKFQFCINLRFNKIKEKLFRNAKAKIKYSLFIWNWEFEFPITITIDLNSNIKVLVSYILLMRTSILTTTCSIISNNLLHILHLSFWLWINEMWKFSPNAFVHFLKSH